jgi:hypothetical protein
MCKHLETASILIIGTTLTVICAGSGLDRLLTTMSCPRRSALPREMRTVLIRVENVDVREAAAVLRKASTTPGGIGFNRAEQLVRITDWPRNVGRLKRILREVDRHALTDPVGLPIERGPRHDDATDRASRS